MQKSPSTVSFLCKFVCVHSFSLFDMPDFIRVWEFVADFSSVQCRVFSPTTELLLSMGGIDWIRRHEDRSPRPDNLTVNSTVTHAHHPQDHILPKLVYANISVVGPF